MEIFDQAGTCVPPVAMVPVDGGVDGVLVVGAASRRPPDHSRKQAVEGRAGLAQRSQQVGSRRGHQVMWAFQAAPRRHPLGGRVRTHAPVRHPQRAISAGQVEAERPAPESLPPVDANPPS